MNTRLLGGLGLVLIVAFVLRARQLQEVPQVTDESAEVLFAWDIAFEGARPLTHTDSYNGPLWPYLMAGSLRTIGPSVELPRQFTLAFGLAAVAAAFALGAMLAPGGSGASAGVIAGLIMAANYTHTLVGSRVAWSNSTTPFWTTLTVIALLLAVREPASIRRWAAAGLLAGLALNTHPSVAVFLMGLAIWWLLVPERRPSLRRPGPWVAAITAFAAYLPVVAHNLRTRGDTFSQAAASRNVEADPGLAAWLENVGAMTLQLGRSLGGGFAPDGSPIWGAGALVFVAAAGWLLVAGATARDDTHSGRRLPLVVCAAGALALPLINRNWAGFLEARYLTFLVPLIGAAAAVAITGPGSRLRRAVSAACAVALVAVPASRSIGYVTQAVVTNQTNRELLAMVAMAKSESRGGAAVFVDQSLKELSWPNRGDPRRAVTYYLTLAGVPHEVASLDKIRYLVAHGEPRPAGASVAPTVVSFLAKTDVGSAGNGRLQPLLERRAVVVAGTAGTAGAGFAGFPAWGLYEITEHETP